MTNRFAWEDDDIEVVGHMSIEPHGSLGAMPKAVFNRAVERVAFAVIEQRTLDMENEVVPEFAALVAKATKRALGSDDNLSQLVDNDPADIAALQFERGDVGKIKSAARQMLNRAWTLGSTHASNELERARGSRLEASVRQARFASLQDKAAGYLEGRAFTLAGNLSDSTKAIIQSELQAAVKYGTPLPEVRAAIWDRLVAKGLTSREAAKGVETDDAVNGALDELWVDTDEQALSYLNTIVRTNVFDALNEARFDEFTDPELADFVLAMRYAAVLDSSTTDICQALGTGDGGDGVVYKADNPLWDTYRPPNHYNCRSVLVPVTTLDGWDGEESDPPDVEPQDGFK